MIAAEATEVRTGRDGGRSLRQSVPRSSHGDWAPAPDREDPIDILRRQDESRDPRLVPIRHGRMLRSPLAFFRGSAAIMAADLARTPITGITVQSCGDAHLANFGVFAAPDGRLVFDISDFDETLAAPWEWDLKRLAASFAIAGRDRGFGDKARARCVLAAAGAYRASMRDFAGMRTIDVWYARLDVGALAAHWADVARAGGEDDLPAHERLTVVTDGRSRIAGEPAVVMPLEELVGGAEADGLETRLRGYLEQYRGTVGPERSALLAAYEPVDVAQRVAGVGGVGTRAWIVLLLGRDADDPLFLQIKEAGPSVLEPFVDARVPRNQGRRVVEGQHLMQVTGDILLGWLHDDGDADGRPRDYYVRQLWDATPPVPIDTMPPEDLAAHARVCGWTLARAHARTGDRFAIAGYLGSGDRFDRALVRFAEAYADQNERDHAALAEAVRAGLLEADPER
jgi:uncharacterized protein (DUF2252 family)